MGCNSQRRWLRFVGHRLRHLFPYVPGQSGYNRRLLDATSVPCGASRETVKRSDLAGWAGYGYDRSHPRWYWGLKLYLLAAPDGMPVACDQGLLRPGMVIAAGKGLAGHRFAQGVGQLGAVLVRPDRRDEPHRWGSLGGIRQWIEGIIDTLKDQLGLERHGAHTPQGLWVRVTQRLPALAAGIWFNWQLGVADKRNLVAYDPGFKSPQLHHHRSAGQLALEAMDFGCGSCDQVDHLGQACRPARVNPPVAVKARERELALSVRRLAALDDRLSGR